MPNFVFHFVFCDKKLFFHDDWFPCAIRDSVCCLHFANIKGNKSIKIISRWESIPTTNVFLNAVDKTQKLRIKLTWHMEELDAFFGWARYDILRPEIHVSDSLTHSLSTQDDMLILSNGMAWHLSWQSSHRLTLLICEERPIKRFYCTFEVNLGMVS